MIYRILSSILIAGVIVLAQSPAIVCAHSSIIDIYSSTDSTVSTVSDNSTRPLVDYDDLIVLLSDYQSATGTTSDLYLQYYKYVLSTASYGDHYVAFSSTYNLNNRSYTYYIIALGDLDYNAGTRTFNGSGVDVYKFYPNADSYNGYVNYNHSIDSAFSYTFSGGITFTDLSSDFPDLRTQDVKYLYVMLSVTACAVTFYTITKFGWRNASRRRQYR